MLCIYGGNYNTVEIWLSVSWKHQNFYYLNIYQRFSCIKESQTVIHTLSQLYGKNLPQKWSETGWEKLNKNTNFTLYSKDHPTKTQGVSLKLKSFLNRQSVNAVRNSMCFRLLYRQSWMKLVFKCTSKFTPSSVSSVVTRLSDACP